MPWIRFSDNWTRHAKLRVVTVEARWLWVVMISHAAEYLTDGFVPDNVIEAEGPGSQDLARQLEAAIIRDGGTGLVVRCPLRGGWVVHDYLEFNPTRAEVLASRKKDREKKRKGRKNQKRKLNGQFTAKVLSPGDTPGDTPRDPTGDPTGPDPVPLSEREILNPGEPRFDLGTKEGVTVRRRKSGEPTAIGAVLFKCPAPLRSAGGSNE